MGRGIGDCWCRVDAWRLSMMPPGKARGVGGSAAGSRSAACSHVAVEQDEEPQRSPCRCSTDRNTIGSVGFNKVAEVPLLSVENSCCTALRGLWSNMTGTYNFSSMPNLLRTAW